MGRTTTAALYGPTHVAVCWLTEVEKYGW